MNLLIEDYLNFYQFVGGNSELTAKTYRSDLTLFFKYLLIRYGKVKPKTKLEDIDISVVDEEMIKNVKPEDLFGFIAFCDKTLKNSNNTKRKKAIAIRVFFEYLHKTKKLIDENPAEDLKPVKAKESLPVYLSLNEANKLLESIDGTNKERDYCMITLFLNCGMRLSELINIDTDDIRDDILTVIGKGDKPRTIYLNEMCLDALEEYLNVRPNADTNALFLSNRKKRISKRTVQNLIKKYTKKAGLDSDKISIHKLRHTSATLLYKHGNIDIRTIQKILGHNDVSTTQIYTHVDEEQLRDAVKKNPLSALKKGR